MSRLTTHPNLPSDHQARPRVRRRLADHVLTRSGLHNTIPRSRLCTRGVAGQTCNVRWRGQSGSSGLGSNLYDTFLVLVPGALPTACCSYVQDESYTNTVIPLVLLFDMGGIGIRKRT